MQSCAVVPGEQGRAKPQRSRTKKVQGWCARCSAKLSMWWLRTLMPSHTEKAHFSQCSQVHNSASTWVCKFILAWLLFFASVTWKMKPWLPEPQHVCCLLMQNLAQALFESTPLNIMWGHLFFGWEPNHLLAGVWVYYFYLLWFLQQTENLPIKTVSHRA